MKTRTPGTSPRLRSTVARGCGWLTVAGMLAFALLGPAAGSVSADPGGNGQGSDQGQGAGLQHDGDQGGGTGAANGKGNGGAAQGDASSCGTSEGTTILVDGPREDATFPERVTGSADGVSVLVTYDARAALSFEAAGGVVKAVYLESGNRFVAYRYLLAGTTEATGLTGPENNGGHSPRISRALFCVDAATPSATTDPSSSPEASSTPDATESPQVSSSPEASSTPDATESPEVSSSPEASATPGGSESPESTATPDASSSPEVSSNPEATSSPDASSSPEITSSPETTSGPTGGGEVADATGSPDATVSPSPSPTGSVAGVSGTPAATPPATDILTSRPSPASNTWRLILVALAAFLASLLVLTPAESRVRSRRK